MIKNNKLKLFLTSLLILLPTLLGFFGEKLFPEEIAVHWGFDNKADGFMSAGVVFFLLPAIMLAIHWGAILLSSAVGVGKEQNKKIVDIIFWTVPVITVFSCATIASTALGHTANLPSLVFLFLGVVFIIIGNYTPKITRNITSGIKIKWTMANDENWQATHRFGGKVMVGVGVLSLCVAFLPKEFFIYSLVTMIILTVLLPTLYSYFFYKKQIAEGKATKESYDAAYREILKKNRSAGIAGVVTVVVLLIVLPILLFTGEVKTELLDDSLRVTATFWGDLELDYSKIDSVEYREEGVDGERIGGFGSPRLLLGNFQNDELGAYTRYTYGGDKPAIILKSGKRVVVVGGKDEKETLALYRGLIEKTK